MNTNYCNNGHFQLHWILFSFPAGQAVFILFAFIITVLCFILLLNLKADGR